MHGFDQFWEHYPRKIGKAECAKYWPRAVKAAGGDVDRIIKGAQNEAKIHEADDRPKAEKLQYVPYPKRWLQGIAGTTPLPRPVRCEVPAEGLHRAGRQDRRIQGVPREQPRAGMGHAG